MGACLTPEAPQVDWGHPVPQEGPEVTRDFRQTKQPWLVLST